MAEKKTMKVKLVRSVHGRLQKHRACVRGLAIKERVQHPDRLIYPMRRSGPRGSGKFERISWDEALDEIAAVLVEVLERRGGEGAVLLARAHLPAGSGRRERSAPGFVAGTADRLPDY